MHFPAGLGKFICHDRRTSHEFRPATGHPLGRRRCRYLAHRPGLRGPGPQLLLQLPPVVPRLRPRPRWWPATRAASRSASSPGTSAPSGRGPWSSGRSRSTTAHRGRGLAAAMLDGSPRGSRDHGVTVVETTVTPDNDRLRPAVHLLRRAARRRRSSARCSSTGCCSPTGTSRRCCTASARSGEPHPTDTARPPHPRSTAVTITPPDLSVFESLESEVRSYCRGWPAVFDRAQGSRLTRRGRPRLPGLLRRRRVARTTATTTRC